MRRRFGKLIAELADVDEKIHVLVGDIGYRVFDECYQEWYDSWKTYRFSH